MFHTIGASRTNLPLVGIEPRFRVVIIDEDEARQEVVTTDRAKAMRIANANRWSTIYAIS